MAGALDGAAWRVAAAASDVPSTTAFRVELVVYEATELAPAGRHRLGRSSNLAQPPPLPNRCPALLISSHRLTSTQNVHRHHHQLPRHRARAVRRWPAVRLGRQRHDHQAERQVQVLPQAHQPEGAAVRELHELAGRAGGRVMGSRDRESRGEYGRGGTTRRGKRARCGVPAPQLPEVYNHSLQGNGQVHERGCCIDGSDYKRAVCVCMLGSTHESKEQTTPNGQQSSPLHVRPSVSVSPSRPLASQRVCIIEPSARKRSCLGPSFSPKPSPA
jgi:hypothetical protein